MAVASLILGIVAIVFSLIVPFLFWVWIVVGVVGIILGALGRKNAKEAGEPTGIATGGLVTSIIGTVLALIMWMVCAAAVSGGAKILEEAAKNSPELQKSLEDAQNSLKELEENK